MTETLAMDAANPFARRWDAPFGLPPFGEIKPAYMQAAFPVAFAQHQAEIDAIAGNSAPPTFANVIDALEDSGRALSRLCAVFYNLSGADTNDALQAIEREVAPLMSRHWSAISMSEPLFARVDAVFGARETLKLTPEQARVLERTHDDFVRSGARLKSTDKARLAAISEKLAGLGTQFAQNMLKDESSYVRLLDKADDLAGLPEFLTRAMAKAAEDRGNAGLHAVTLSRSIIEPFLTFSTQRALREETFTAWSRRGENGGATDNRALVAEMVQLRAEKAKLLGFATFAHLKLDNAMAKTPEAVRDLLELVWAPAKARAAREAADLAALASGEGHDEAIRPWDWRHYAEKVRSARFALDEAAIKPYLQLDNVIAASFHVATKLFGLSFAERKDLSGYHPEARIFEVNRADGSHLGLFMGDWFARPSKRSGAWMSAWRSQQRLAGDIRPIIVNVCNFAKPAAGQPALLSFDDARTLFHEFGHALHGLMSDVTYPSIAGTAVSRDFVELPSQLFEHWFMTREVMERFCLHAETGQAMPSALIDKIKAAQTFNQGFMTVEYTSSALVDLAFHSLEQVPEKFDPLAFEAAELARIGMPAEITMRHRTPHFAHVFSGDGYSAGYYSYLWSEVMDADAFNAFVEAGDVFAPAVAAKLERYVYSAGNSRDPAEAYTLFRGRLPTPDALLKKRGLAA
ncbi:MAG: M3 family metallopeptidase [Bosea sp. (in: a-proteobacteria)]